MKPLLLILALITSNAVARPLPPFNFRSEPDPDDQAADLVDEFKLRDLKEIDALKLNSAFLTDAPWAGDYWAMANGGIAARYLDPEFPGSFSWKLVSDYLLPRLGGPTPDLISPAEKYDLLVGDTGFGLSKAALDEGRRYYVNSGRVESWMGICHGWAAAALAMARPKHTVELLAADGTTRLAFLPSDIKALASALWANGSAPTRFIGKRCDLNRPPADGSGRPTETACVDTNPATLHLALVNQIGVSQRGLVMDMNYAYQVWNQPISGYSFRFFNLITGVESDDWKDLRVSRRNYAEDPRAQFRSAHATHLLGVRAQVTYITEERPNASPTDEPDLSETAVTGYEYDLELDDQGMILGGEWRSTNHPDFLWTPMVGAHAKGYGDYELDRLTHQEEWKAGDSVPSSWKASAIRGSKWNQPLGHIIEELVRRAQ